MKENSKKIKMFDYPILNTKIFKKKIPFILGDRSHSKFNLNLEMNNNNLYPFYKKAKKKNGKIYNNKKNEYETEYFPNNDRNEYNIKKGYNQNSIISKIKDNSSDNYSFISSIKNNSFYNLNKENEKNINNNIFNENDDYYTKKSNSKKDIFFKKNIFDISEKKDYTYDITNNKFSSYNNSEDKEENKSNIIFNYKNNKSCLYKQIKTEFNIDEDIKFNRPNPEPFPKKYNKYHSYDNKNNVYDYNINSNREEYFNTSICNGGVNVTERNYYIDQKLLFVLKNLKIENLYDLFINNGIYFKDLFLLNKDDLIEIKVPIGPRNRILYFIKLYVKSAKNYDFEELHNFFKEFNNNNKVINNLKKYIIPHPRVNLPKNLTKINKEEIQKKLNIKTLNNKINKIRINKKEAFKNINKIYLKTKKDTFEEVKNISNNTDNKLFKDILNKSSSSKIKNKPGQLKIDEITNIKSMVKSSSFYLKSHNTNFNQYKNKKGNNIKTNKNFNLYPCPIPKKSQKVKSVKYINTLIEDNSFNKNKIYNKFKKDEALAEIEKRIKHNYEIFKKNREKYGNKLLNSFLEN